MHFLQVNVTSYDAVKMIHDVIRTANPCPYAAKFMFGRYFFIYGNIWNPDEATRNLACLDMRDFKVLPHSCMSLN